MSLRTYLNRIEQFDQLIRTRRTGPPVETARKLGLAPSTFYRLVDELKGDYGFPIKYDRMRKTYFYNEDGKLINLRFQKLIKN